MFLKEPIGTARLVALVVGFLGVLIVTNPGSETFQIGALFALGNALLFGTVTAGVRGMTTTELAKTLTMYQLILLSIFYGLTLPFFFVMPTWGDMPLIVANGATNMLGQYWWTRAIHLAPTSAVVPFQYLSLIWAMGFGFALWGDVPTIGLIIGSVIVVGSGLFLLWHESRPKRRKMAAAALRKMAGLIEPGHRPGFMPPSGAGSAASRCRSRSPSRRRPRGRASAGPCSG